MSIDYHVELIAFPSGKVHEAVTLNEDGSATIFLDKNATKESQMKRFMHVIKHLDGFDFDKSNVQEIEINAHTKESLL